MFMMSYISKPHVRNWNGNSLFSFIGTDYRRFPVQIPLLFGFSASDYEERNIDDEHEQQSDEGKRKYVFHRSRRVGVRNESAYGRLRGGGRTKDLAHDADLHAKT